MELTMQSVVALIEQLIADNTSGEITALDVRTAMIQGSVAFTAQTDAKVEAITTIANAAMDLAEASRDKNVEQDGRLDALDGSAGAVPRIDGELQNIRDSIENIMETGDASGLTPEQVELNRVARQANTDGRIAQAMDILDLQGDVSTLKENEETQNTAIELAQTTANDAKGLATTANTDLEAAISRIAANERDIANAPVGGTTEAEKTEIAKIEGIEDDIGEEGAVGQPGTGLKGRAKALEAADVEIRGLISAFGDGSFSAEDLLVRSGVTAAQTPGVAYRGSGDQEFVNANPGVVFQRATGEFTIPAVSLTDVPAGTQFRFSGAYLNAGKTGRQSGFDPILYYVIEQGTSRIVGRGDAGSDTDLARNWVALDNIESPSELRTDHLVTGADIIVRWIAIYDGVDATLVPSLSAGNISFVGEFEPAIEAIVHDVTDARFNAIEATAETLEGTVAASAVAGASTKRNSDANTVLINGVRMRLALPQYQAIEEATVVETETPVVAPSTLNTDLGASGQPFARNSNEDIGTATQFITRFTDSHQVLDYGAGRVADVFDGHIRIFRLVEARAEQTNTETRYITTRSGYGTRTRPAVLEFGSIPPGQTVRQAADTELFLDTGIPANPLPSGTTISNVSMAFAVRTNGNWNSIANTLQFAIRSGEVRFFALPAPIDNVLFRATGLADGRIHCESLHRDGVGNANDLVTNAGAIRFDAAYVETVVTPAVARGQTTEDGGPFTGDNLIAIDVGQTGDSDTETATIVTPTTTYDTGYFLREAHRTGFRTENQAFDVFVSDNNTALTPAVLAQLDGADATLGLFTTTNRHGERLVLGKQISAVSAKGVVVPDMAGSIIALEEGGGGGTGTAISEASFQRGGIYNPTIIESVGRELDEFFPAISESRTQAEVGNFIATSRTSRGDFGDVVNEVIFPVVPLGRPEYTFTFQGFSEALTALRARLFYTDNDEEIWVTPGYYATNTVYDFWTSSGDGDGSGIISNVVDITRPVGMIIQLNRVNSNTNVTFRRFEITSPEILGDDVKGLLVDRVAEIAGQTLIPVNEQIKDLDELTKSHTEAIAANTEKVGVPDGLLDRVAVNDAKVGVPDGLLDRVAANDAKPDTNESGRIADGRITAQLTERGSIRSALSVFFDLEGVTNIADSRITRQLQSGGSIAAYVAANAGSGGGTTQVEKDAIAANTLKPTNDDVDSKITDAISGIVFPTPPVQRTDDQVNTLADARIVEQIKEGGTIDSAIDTAIAAISPTGGGGGTTQAEKDDIAANKRAIFGDTLAGVYDGNNNFVGGDSSLRALKIGDVVMTSTIIGGIEYYELIGDLNDSMNTTASVSTTYGPRGDRGADYWTRVTFQEGLNHIVDEHSSDIETLKANPAGATAADVATQMLVPISESQTYTVSNLATEEYPLDVVPPAMATQGGTLSGRLILGSVASPIEMVAYRVNYTDSNTGNPIIAATGLVAVETDGTNYFVIVPDTAIEARPFQFRIMQQGAKSGESVSYTFGGQLAVGEKGVLTDGVIAIVEQYGGGGGAVATDEQVRNALVEVATTAPFSYNVKFAQDNSGQVARAFRDRATIPIDFELDENQGASNDTNITIKMFADDETLPNNITANNPFMTRWEGTMNIANNGNGALFARITQRITHFAGTPNEFSNDRNAVVRLTNVDNQSIPMSYFDSTVSLSQATIDRFPTDETQPLQLELKIEFSTTADFAVLLTRDSPIVKQSLVTEFNGIGISFLQHNASAIVGFDGASPEQAQAIAENTAEIATLKEGGSGGGASAADFALAEEELYFHIQRADGKQLSALADVFGATGTLDFAVIPEIPTGRPSYSIKVVLRAQDFGDRFNGYFHYTGDTVHLLDIANSVSDRIITYTVPNVDPTRAISFTTTQARSTQGSIVTDTESDGNNRVQFAYIAAAGDGVDGPLTQAIRDIIYRRLNKAENVPF